MYTGESDGAQRTPDEGQAVVRLEVVYDGKTYMTEYIVNKQLIGNNAAFIDILRLVFQQVSLSTLEFLKKRLLNGFEKLSDKLK